MNEEKFNFGLLAKILILLGIIFLAVNCFAENDEKEKERPKIEIKRESFEEEEDGEDVSNSKRDLQIGILVLMEPNNSSLYTRAADSLQCYARIHSYDLIYHGESHKNCKQKDSFYRRYCIVGQFLAKYDYLLLLDADIGVVNPQRKIEEFIDPEFDITFYERYYNQEIMSGSLLLKRTEYAKNFIKGLSNYNFKNQKIFDTGSGALHMYVTTRIFQERPEEYENCMKIYTKAKKYEDLQVFKACIKTVLGVPEHFPHIRILRKGTGWARDSYITNSLWNPERDFMMHLWKQPYLRKLKKSDLPILPKHENHGSWYDPIQGNFEFDRCMPGENYYGVLPTTTPRSTPTGTCSWVYS